MKKYVVSLMALLVAIVASSFTAGSIKEGSVKKANVVQTSQWYNFYGSNLFDMCDPSMYGLDENNWPDCPIAVGLIYCEIYARPGDVEGEPDLMTITNSRMRSLL